MIEQVLISQCQMVPDKPVIVGVSGGPDSLTLLDSLYRLGYQVISAHFDHKLRLESRNEAVQVSRVAEIMGVPCVRSEADVYEYAKGKGLSIEEAARELRYEFLFTVAYQENAQAVAVGHNADDRVETFLMHLIRGAGFSGLRGMSFRTVPNPWSHEIPLVRPLLGIWRGEILRYCNDRGLNPIIDQSNLDTSFFRNRLRHDLIPTLEEYNPKIKEIILRTADILSEDYETITKTVDKAWEKCLDQLGDGYIALNINWFQGQRLGVQRYLIRKAIAHHRPDLRDINFDTVERTISFINKPSETLECDLAAGLMLHLEGNRLWIIEQNAALPESGFPLISEKAILNISIPGKLDLDNGWVLQVKIARMSDSLMEAVLNNDDPFVAYLDRSKLNLALQVRTRRPGDRIQPLGMDGISIKVSDFMINMKIPRRNRGKWPLICSQGKIIWIPGYRIHHAYRITPATKSIVFLQLSISEQTEVDVG